MSEEGGLKIKYVQKVMKNGTSHYYFRKGDYREGPLRSPPGTYEMQAEVTAIVKRLERVAAAHNKPKTGTIAGIMAVYAKSAEFLALARSTQREYQYVIDELTEDCGEILLKDLSRSWLMEMRNAWAQRGHRVSDLRVQVLKNACQPIIDDDKDLRIDGDPFHNVKKAPRPHDAGEAHPVWEEHEFEAALAQCALQELPGLARALALARWAGYRRGTICALPRHARILSHDRQGNSERRLYWVTEKRQVQSDKREDPRLTALLDSTPNKALTIAYNANGQPWKERQLSQAFDRLLMRLVKLGKVRGHLSDSGDFECPLTLHGLRHTRGVELANAGASDAEIMTQLEHKTEAAAKIYRRQAMRREMADNGQDKVDNVIELRARRATVHTVSG